MQQPTKRKGSVFAGAFSAIPCTVMMTPIERIKVLLQTQEAGTKVYSGPADVARQLLRQGGIRSLYTGTMATLIRDVPGSAAYFAAYDITKAALMPAAGPIGIGGTLFAGSNSFYSPIFFMLSSMMYSYI